MADEITSSIAMTDPTLTSALGLPEYQYGVNIVAEIAPDVEVYNQNFKARVFGGARFKKAVRVSRPRGGDSERVTRSSMDPKNFSIDEKSLKDVMDRRDVDEARNAPDGGYDLRLQVALDTKGQLLTTIETGAADMFLTHGNYPGNNKSNDAATVFPGATIQTKVREAQYAIIKKQKVRAGHLIITPELWADVQGSSTIKDSLKYTTGQVLTEEMLAAFLQVDKVTVPLTVWDTEAGDGSFVWSGKKALLFHNRPNPGMNGPCFAKTFFRKVNGLREEVRTAFDMPGNEHFYVVREEDTVLVFPESGFLWY
jgi:hypothetical protein